MTYVYLSVSAVSRASAGQCCQFVNKGIHGRLAAGPADPAGESPGNQETSRWDPAGHADNQPWITFLTRELFIQNIFISYNK